MDELFAYNYNWINMLEYSEWQNFIQWSDLDLYEFMQLTLPDSQPASISVQRDVMQLL